MPDEPTDDAPFSSPDIPDASAAGRPASTTVGGLTQRLLWAWEQKREDHEYALLHRSEPTGEDAKGRPVFDPPAWGVEDMAGGAEGRNPEFVVEELADEHLRNALSWCFDQVEENFDYRDPDSGISSEDRDVINTCLEQTLDTYESLTENQRQAMIDLGPLPAPHEPQQRDEKGHQR